MRNLSKEMGSIKKEEQKGKYRTETIHIRNEKFSTQALSLLNTTEQEII